MSHSVSPPTDSNIPENLERATLRLNFPPIYVVVGAYRLLTDEMLYKPAWQKCSQGVRRGATASIAWACLSWGIQRRIVRALLNGPFSFSFMNRAQESVTGLSEERFMGVKLPFSTSSYVALFLVGAQVTVILKFFISHNIRTARQQAWDQTVASRGKGVDFWQPYVEERDAPPVVKDDFATGMKDKFGLWFISVFVKKVLVVPLSLYPFVGTLAIAALKAMDTSHYLHKPYFKAKKMTPHQIAVFTEEQKWAYRSFGFTAALLESLPILGLVFSVSNRIGAAMWAHDLEKRQHCVAASRKGPR